MIDGGRFESASGLRPASAFVLIGAVLGLVALRGAQMATLDEGEQPRNLTQLEMPELTFDIVDTSGIPLALSVESLELVMSPNATWQAHTPDKVAFALSRVLGGAPSAGELLEKMLPDARAGVIRVDTRALRMNAEQAARVHRWIQMGSLDPEAEPARIEGMWVHPTALPGEYGLTWVPRVVLSERMRAAHRVTRPLDWTRRIADDLTECVAGAEIQSSIDTEEERKAWRKAVWDALLPTQFKSVVKEVPAAAALAVHELLKEQRLQPHQMSLRRHAKRMYPPQAAEKDDIPLAVLGRWGTLEPELARKLARKELRLPADEHCTEQELELLKSYTSVKVYQPSAMSGLELYCQRLLERPEWQFLVRKPEEYTFLANQVPRQAPARYFQELVPASETPRVVTTLDVRLQRQMRAWLAKVMAEQRPAVVQGIAIDLSNGDVLAVDALDPYDMGGFLPTTHAFTPGSTTKVLVMAAALDAGVVTPSTVFDTGDGSFKIASRTIHEAEGAPTGRITAAGGLAYSVNAVLVQIGVRVPAQALHDMFVDLGYGDYPQAGLGGERRGDVPELPWRTHNQHASVSFGHELMVTLWQQAAALAAVVRGGEFLPLRLVDAIEQNGVSHPVPIAAPRRVFSAETCAKVREMMFMGAREGTGKKVYCDDIVMGTKTGTAQKVPGEVCLHVELAHNRDHKCRGARACRAKLKGERAHKSSCYTSSMCIFGKLPDDDREIMVLVVVDEPRGGKKYGSDVAGPAAAGVLKEALGYTRDGVRVEPLPEDGFAPLDELAASELAKHFHLSDAPWSEVAGASH